MEETPDTEKKVGFPSGDFQVQTGRHGALALWQTMGDMSSQVTKETRRNLIYLSLRERSQLGKAPCQKIPTI